jgi:hypothetical protein
MSISLPERANLEFLKKQSKDLQRAFAAGEAEAVNRIHHHRALRTRSLAQDQLDAMELSLQEAQHALVCEYGFAKWEALTAAVEAPGFDDLAKLTDREIQILMREVDQKVLVTALLGAPENILQRFLQNMSECVRGFIRTEIDFLGNVPAADVAAAREQLLSQVRALGEWITWPPQDIETTPSPAAPPDEDPRLAPIGRGLADVREDDIADALRALADRAKLRGILSLEACFAGVRGTLLTEGIRLVVDGTEPDLVVDMLSIRAATILRNRTIRGRMVIEGLLAIHSGDNPAIVAQKLTTYFVEEAADIPALSRELSAEDLAAFLQETPMRAMTLAQLVDFFRDLAILARHRGLQALVPLIDQVQDDAVTALGLVMIVQPDMSPAQFMERVGQQLQDERVALHQRHCLVIKGMAGIQAGKKPDALVAEAREWAQMQAVALPMALTPQATALS